MFCALCDYGTYINFTVFFCPLSKRNIRVNDIIVFMKQLLVKNSDSKSTVELNLCMHGNFSCFCCHLLIFFKVKFFKTFFQEHYQSVKGFGSRSGLTFWVQIVLKVISI